MFTTNNRRANTYLFFFFLFFELIVSFLLNLDGNNFSLTFNPDVDCASLIRFKPRDRDVSHGCTGSFGFVMMAVVSQTLLPSKTASDGDVALYSPKRVMRQLGYDQGQ